MKRTLIALAFVTACSAGQKAPTTTATEPIVPPLEAGAPAAASPKDNRETRAVARMLTRVSELRGLRATRQVPGVKLPREQLVERVKEKALREYPPEALRREGQLLQIMGFAPATFDYLGAMMKLLETQLEGFYEPKDGTMYLASDLRGMEAQATLAHELVHALQDQKWDLRSRSTYRPGKGDETLALAALAEGDATSLMMDLIMAEQDRTALDLSEDLVRELMKTGASTGDAKDVPHILKTSLIAPYIDGLAFVHALRRKGGWSAVDKAWERLPKTTEQILHVEKWEADEKALDVPAPTANALGAGWKKDDEDTFGELGFALTFEEWVEAKDARIAASGWGGDRSALYSKGDELAFADHIRFDRPSFSERAMMKLLPGLRRKLGKPSIDALGTLCFDRPETGPLLFSRKDAELVMIAGPAKATGTAWTASAKCADVKKWADEILAQK